MAVKSVIDVEVNDEHFKEFAKLFEKYQAALGATPGMWAKAEAATKGTALNVENLVAALLTHEAINRKIAREEEDKRKKLAQQNLELTRQRQAYKDIARSVFDTLASITKWTAYTGVASGLLGFGSLLGIDRLAEVTGSGRRTAQGLGTSYGEAKAFENSYDRVVDAKGFLGGVNEALTDVTKRASLYGAGLTNADISGKDTAQVANELLPALKRIADRTPDSQLAQVLQARGLGQFVTVEDLRRLKATTPEELRSIQSGYGAKASQFNVEDKIARKWQDLGVQLDSAKIKIEGVLVTGLEKLAGPLGSLSDHVANALAAFIKGLDQKTLGDIGQGIEDLGKYLGSPQFRTDVKNFATDVSYAAKKIAGALRWLGILPGNNPANGADPNDSPSAGDRARGAAVGTVAGAVGGAVVGSLVGPGGTAVGARVGAYLGGAAGAILPNGVSLLGQRAYAVGSPNWTNPGNIRWPGTDKFVRFDSDKSGIRAIARQLGLYGSRDHLDTISKIIAKYAPAKDHNNVAAYVADVARTTGFGANQSLNLSDADTVAKLTAAITKHEGRRAYTVEEVKKYMGVDAAETAAQAKPTAKNAPAAAPKAAPAAKPKVTVDVKVSNNTGGSAIVQSSQVAGQG